MLTTYRVNEKVQKQKIKTYHIKAAHSSPQNLKLIYKVEDLLFCFNELKVIK